MDGPSGALWANFSGQKAIFILFWLFLAPLGPHLGYVWAGKWPKPVCLDVLSDVPTSFQPVPQNIVFRHIQPLLFWPLLTSFEPLGQFIQHFNLEKSPHLVSLDTNCCVTTLFHSFLPKKKTSGPICVAKRQFQQTFAIFVSPLGHIWDNFGLSNEPNLLARVSSVLFQRCSHIVPFIGGHIWSNYDNVTFCPLWGLFGPLEGPNMSNTLWASWNGGQCKQWDQKKSLMTAMGHFY